MSNLISSKIGIVIVSYNSAAEIATCITAAQTALKEMETNGDVVVVDNHSADKSKSIAINSGAHVIENEHNEGFAKAVNEGIRYLFSNKATHILILNPDAIIEPESLGILFECFNKNKKIGAAGPAMFNNKGESTNVGYYLKAPSWISVLCFSTILRPHFLKHSFFVKHFYEETDLEKNREVEQIPGACLLTSREVLDNVGLLDEDFAIWYEDVEWCYRARNKGFKMWFCHNARVKHEGGVSFAKWQNIDKAVTFYVSMKTFFKKHKPLSYVFVVTIILLNALILYFLHQDKCDLIFAKKFITQKRGILPE